MRTNFHSLLAAGILSLSSIVYSQESTNSLPYGPTHHPVELVIQEQPATVVTEVIEKKEIKERDIVNFISRIDEEKIDSRDKYANQPFFQSWTSALEEEIEKDPLFYAWEEYDERDIVAKNQMLNATWNVLVGKYPKVFGRLEKTGVYLKRITTLQTPKVGRYRLKINGELDEDNYPRIKFKIKSDTENFFNNMYAKVGKENTKIGKTWSLTESGRNAYLDFELELGYNEEICTSLTLKFPFWFGQEKDYKKPSHKIYNDNRFMNK